MKMIDSDQLHTLLSNAYEDGTTYGRRAAVIYLDHFESLTRTEQDEITFKVNQEITNVFVVAATQERIKDRLIAQHGDCNTDPRNTD